MKMGFTLAETLAGLDLFAAALRRMNELENVSTSDNYDAQGDDLLAALGEMGIYSRGDLEDYMRSLFGPRGDKAAEAPWNETNPEWWRSNVEERMKLGGDVVWDWLANECAGREDEAVARYIAKVNTALDRYFTGPREDWRTVAADMAQILMAAADER